MGLLDLLFGNDVTRDWRAAPDLDLEVDFNGFRLCGVTLGERVDRLSDLGPAENRHEARSGLYRYYSKGLSITEHEGTIDLFVLFWTHPDHPEYQPFAGKCVMAGKSLPLTERTTTGEFVEYLGDPDDRDEENNALIYRRGNAVVDVNFSRENELEYIVVGGGDGGVF